jgi:hypothetical protein
MAFMARWGELLSSIEENRTPRNNARDNLQSLAFCFAAIASATEGQPKTVGQVRRLPEGSAPFATHRSRQGGPQMNNGSAFNTAKFRRPRERLSF